MLARRAVVVVFLSNAVLFTSWTAHIPQVKRSLGLSDATLGLALLGAPIGSVTAMVITGYLLTRVSSARMCLATLLCYCATSLGIGFANSPLTLFAALLACGGFVGAMDVSMNTQAVRVEHAAGRPVMSGLHGSWSLGAFTGAAIGAAAVAAGISLAWQLAVLAAIIAVLGGWSPRYLLPEAPARPPPETTSARSRHVLRSPEVLALGLVAFASLFCEGAAADWSAVYLRDSLGARAALAGLGYAAFSASMVTLRLSGDRLALRFRPYLLLPGFASIATVGLAIALVIGTPAAALVGFFLLGAGLALVIPTLFSAAGRIPGVHTGSAVAAVSALGWAGFVVSPPLIGLLAEVTSLPVALALLPILMAILAVVTYRSRVLRAHSLWNGRRVPQRG